MATSIRPPQTMASIVRRSVRTQSRKDQVTEPNSDRAMGLPPPEQAGPPSSFLRFSSFRGSHRSTGGWCPIRVAVMLPLRADEAAVYQHSYPNDTLRSQPV